MQPALYIHGVTGHWWERPMCLLSIIGSWGSSAGHEWCSNHIGRQLTSSVWTSNYQIFYQGHTKDQGYVFTFKNNDGIEGSYNKRYEQAGADQCKAQEKIGLVRNCGNFPLIKPWGSLLFPENWGHLPFTLKFRFVFHLPWNWGSLPFSKNWGCLPFAMKLVSSSNSC